MGHCSRNSYTASQARATIPNKIRGMLKTTLHNFIVMRAGCRFDFLPTVLPPPALQISLEILWQLFQLTGGGYPKGLNCWFNPL